MRLIGYYTILNISKRNFTSFCYKSNDNFLTKTKTENLRHRLTLHALFYNIAKFGCNALKFEQMMTVWNIKIWAKKLQRKTCLKFLSRKSMSVYRTPEICQWAVILSGFNICLDNMLDTIEIYLFTWKNFFLAESEK